MQSVKSRRLADTSHISGAEATMPTRTCGMKTRSIACARGVTRIRAYVNCGSNAAQQTKESCLPSRDLHLGPATQLHVEPPIHSKVHALDVVEIDDLLAVGTKEPLGIQTRLEAREGAPQQRVTLLPGEPHVIAFGSKELHLAERHEPAPIAVAEEEPLDDSAADHRSRGGTRRCGLGAGHGCGKALGLNRFEEVVQR